jgi:hypothetical protein
MAHTAPTAHLVLHRKRIGKGAVKNSESIGNGGVNLSFFTRKSRGEYPCTFGKVLSGIGQGITVFVATFPIVNDI